MLTKTSHLKGMAIHATDGELGKINQFYFEDNTWAVRYLTVETGSWLTGREVLISPYSITKVDWDNKHLYVALTKRQVEQSPGIDTDLPVSRQQEASYLGYYGYPQYWGGPYLWGSVATPLGLTIPLGSGAEVGDAVLHRDSADSHLRSDEAVEGYQIEAADGEIGHVNGFVVDDEAWAIRYIEVATRNWLPGKKVLVAPEWIEKISWMDLKVYTRLTAEAIQNAPEYLEDSALTREYEDKLHAHYGQPPYWAGSQPVCARKV